jgi:SAM-dependent methyltransferase
MSQLFNKNEVFDEDYLYFYETALDSNKNDREASLIKSLLDLPLNSSILDAPCGTGRISNRLAKYGYNVSGVDFNKDYLKEAKIEAEENNLKVRYYNADIRSFTGMNDYDCVLNWHNSFGYFDDTDNRRLLLTFYNSLKPGGKILIEQVNRDKILKLLLPGGALWTDAVLRDGNMVIDRIRYSVDTGRMDVIRVSTKNGKLQQKPYSFRVLTLPEMKNWLTAVGFSNISAYGENGKPYTLESKRMIVIAEK